MTSDSPSVDPDRFERLSKSLFDKDSNELGASEARVLQGIGFRHTVSQDAGDFAD